jgi:hypothetical protein
MSVIPATQEAEIRTTVIQSQPGFMRKKFMRPYTEKKNHGKRVGGVAQGEGPEFKP